MGILLHKVKIHLTTQVIYNVIILCYPIIWVPSGYSPDLPLKANQLNTKDVCMSKIEEE